MFDLSKLEIAAIAREQAWEDLMEMTWLCHRQTSDLKPCGRCKPCIYTIEEGLSWRLPLRSRAAYFFSKQSCMVLQIPPYECRKAVGAIEQSQPIT